MFGYPDKTLSLVIDILLVKSQNSVKASTKKVDLALHACPTRLVSCLQLLDFSPLLMTGNELNPGDHLGGSEAQNHKLELRKVGHNNHLR